MTVFLDTSAILAVLDADDQRHSEAHLIWSRLLASGEELLSSNYVIVETISLVQRRLGLQAARAVETDIVPLLDLHWMSPAMHQAAVRRWWSASRRGLSLVDCSSFEVMLGRDVRQAFAFDSDFEQQGFALLRA